jgi:peptide/nickel transport system ATP-binding protein
MMNPLLSIRNLSVEYRLPYATVRAVERVWLDVDEGASVGIVGESGSGKSTLALSIMRLLPSRARVSSGQVLLDGRDLLTLDSETMRRIRGQKLGMIFQDPTSSLNPVMRVKDHFVELFRTHRPEMGREEVLEIARGLMREMGVSPERMDDYPHQLSGGMRQRVMIGLALALNPKLLIADEPTTSLDVLVEAQILELIRRLKRERQLTLILITHNMGVVAETTDVVAVMYAGRIVEVAKTDELFQEPRHPYTQHLLAAVPRLEPGRELLAIPGAPPDMSMPPPGCRFHPRCPYAYEKCARVEPELYRVGGGLAACHLQGDRA